MKKIGLGCVLGLLTLVVNAKQVFTITDWVSHRPPIFLELNSSGTDVIWLSESEGDTPQVILQSVERGKNENSPTSKAWALHPLEQFQNAMFQSDDDVLLHVSRGEKHIVYRIRSKEDKMERLIELNNPIHLIKHSISSLGFWLQQGDSLQFFDDAAKQITIKEALPENTAVVVFANPKQKCLSITSDKNVYQWNDSQWQLRSLGENLTQLEANFSCETIWSIQRATSGVQHLVEHRDGKAHPLFELKHIDISSVLIDYKKEKVTAVFADGIKPQVVSFDQTMAQLKALLNQYHSAASWRVIGLSEPEAKRVVVSIESPMMPPQIAWVDIKLATVKPLLSPYSDIAFDNIIDVNVISEEQGEEHPVFGYLTSPKHSTKSPLVIQLHGGPFLVRDYWRFDPEAIWLAQNGVATLRINYRGSSGFGQRFQAPAYGQLLEVIEEDVEDIVDSVLKHHAIDKNKICVVGASFGGLAVLNELAEKNFPYRCGVVLNAVTDLDKLYQSLTEELDRQQFKTSFGMPNDPKWQTDHNVLKRTHDINVPLLVVYGDQDERVAPSHSLDLVNQLSNRSLVTVVAINGADHQLSREADRLRYFSELEKFFRKNGLFVTR